MSGQLQLVSNEQAQRLKAAGFDLECPDYYFGDRLIERQNVNDWNDNGSKSASAPSVALALKWARDERRIPSNVYFIPSGWCYELTNIDGKSFRLSPFKYTGDTYEVAESALLDTVLDEIEKTNRVISPVARLRRKGDTEQV